MSNNRYGTLAIVSLCCTLLFLLGHCPLVHSVITIENNGYKGLVVAIHNNVTENPKLLQNIKDMLVKGSAYMYKVTRNRAYLKEATIVVPSSWSQNPNYTVLRSGDLFQEADIRVDNPNPVYGNEPYTLQPGECGEPGRYIHLTPDFLMPDDILLPQDASASSANLNPNLNERSPSMFSPYGDLGPVFVHEFAHLRYGVFDEHGVQGDYHTPLFYMDIHEKIRPTGCPSGIRGLLGTMDGTSCRRSWDGLPDDNCIFYPDLSSKLSIMYMPGVDSADGFCDDDSSDRRHNSLAPNKHNLMCQGRSTWDVVTSHPDFAGNRNPPATVGDTVPTIRVVQPKSSEEQVVVLVLDLSSSMAGRRMELLYAACTRFLRFQVPDKSTVGIVSFSDASRVIAEMTVVSNVTRQLLVQKVPPKQDGGYTAVGSGILKGLEVLKQGVGSTEGAQMILLSDGEENRAPKVADTFDAIKKSGVIVTTVALGKQASNQLEELVKLTGGNGYFYDDQNTASLSGLDASFAAAVTVNAPIELQPVEIGNRNVSLSPSETFDGQFNIDKELGKDTAFRVSYQQASTGNNLELVLTSPSGKKYDDKSTEYLIDALTKTLSFKIPSAESGKWSYSIKNKGSANERISTVISSEATNQQEQPIRVRSWISDVEFTHPARVKVYAEVKKGYAAILNAGVSAVVYRPNGEPHTLVLADNGIGADSTANDGVYSAYFAKFSGSGRYSVEANVINNGQAKLYLGGPGSSPRSSTAPVVPRLSPEAAKKLGLVQESFSPDELPLTKYAPSSQGGVQSVDDFERYSMTGSFKLNNWDQHVDKIAPNRVTDLRVTEAHLDNQTVHLTWTAPGDDLEDDRATFTEIRFHADGFRLQKFYDDCFVVNSSMLVEGTFAPPEPKQPHHVVLQLPLDELLLFNESYKIFFAVRTSDEAGNVAAVSNLATATFVKPRWNEPLANDDKLGPVSLLLLLVIVGCVVFVTVAVVVIVIVVKKARGGSGQDTEGIVTSMRSCQKSQSNDYVADI